MKKAGIVNESHRISAAESDKTQIFTIVKKKNISYKKKDYDYDSHFQGFFL